MKKLLGALVGAFLGTLVALGASNIGAIAQAVSIPTLGAGLLDNTNDRIQIIPKGQPSANNQYVSPSQMVAAAYGYVKWISTQFTQQAVTGCSLVTGTLTTCPGYDVYFGNNQTMFVYNVGATLTYVYLTLAATPNDGQRNCIFTAGAITQVNLAALNSQTVNNAITTLSANTGACYTYSASNTTWDRS